MHVELELVAEPEHVWLQWTGLGACVLAAVFVRVQLHMRAQARAQHQ